MSGEKEISGRQILGDFRACFDNEPGRRVLKWMEKVFGAKETLTPEEAFNEELDRREDLVTPRRPIDPTAKTLREGLRRAYWKIDLMVREATKREER